MKLTSILCAGSLAFALAACSSTAASSKKESASVASSTNEEKKEEVATEGKYDVTNNTGKEVKELYFYDATGTDKGENYAKDGLADGATVTVNVNVDEDKAEGYAMKVEYV